MGRIYNTLDDLRPRRIRTPRPTSWLRLLPFSLSTTRLSSLRVVQNTPSPPDDNS